MTQPEKKKTLGEQINQWVSNSLKTLYERFLKQWKTWTIKTRMNFILVIAFLTVSLLLSFNILTFFVNFLLGVFFVMWLTGVFEARKKLAETK